MAENGRLLGEVRNQIGEIADQQHEQHNIVAGIVEEVRGAREDVKGVRGIVEDISIDRHPPNHTKPNTKYPSQNGSSSSNNKNNKEGEDSSEDEDNPVHRKPRDSQTYDRLSKFLASNLVTDYHKNKQDNLSITKDMDKHLDMIDDVNIRNNNHISNSNSNSKGNQKKKERKKKQLASGSSNNSNDSNVPNPTFQIWNDTVGVNLP